MKKYLAWLTILPFIAVAHIANAGTNIVINEIKEGVSGKSLGEVRAEDSKYGLLITPNLTNLPPGVHGFHLHEKPYCNNDGMGAGGHLDPKKTNKHLGPYNDKGHLGDLPALFVDSNGNANTPVLAPKLTLNQIKNRALMIHAGGDNYSDNPPMGGGGTRIACGIIK